MPCSTLICRIKASCWHNAGTLQVSADFRPCACMLQSQEDMVVCKQHIEVLTWPVPSPASVSRATLQPPPCCDCNVPNTQLFTPALYQTRDPFSKPSKVSCFHAAADGVLPGFLLTQPPPGFFVSSLSCRVRPNMLAHLPVQEDSTAN